MPRRSEKAGVPRGADPSPRIRTRCGRSLRTALGACAAVVLGCAGVGAVDLGSILDAAGGTHESRTTAGLKEALRVGTQRAVAARSRPGGFGKVASLRLSLPDELAPAAKTLRAVGLGRPVDDLEDAMNRAAEAAAGEAVPIFVDAVSSITIADAVGILEGPNDAATRYFRDRTSAALRARFEPIVGAAMQRVGVYRAYRKAQRRYEAMPFAKKLSPDLEGYVLDRTLDGLFATLAREEARIRKDPAARTTALLREVFGTGRSPAAGVRTRTGT